MAPLTPDSKFKVGSQRYRLLERLKGGKYTTWQLAKFMGLSNRRTANIVAAMHKAKLIRQSGWAAAVPGQHRRRQAMWTAVVKKEKPKTLPPNSIFQLADRYR